MSDRSHVELFKVKEVPSYQPALNLYNVYSLVRKGLLRHVRVGGRIFVPRDAIERFERHGLRAVVATTWSHTPERPRWRVYAPLLREVEPTGETARTQHREELSDVHVL